MKEAIQFIIGIKSILTIGGLGVFTLHQLIAPHATTFNTWQVRDIFFVGVLMGVIAVGALVDLIHIMNEGV